jgi:hypothetical protein
MIDLVRQLLPKGLLERLEIKYSWSLEYANQAVTEYIMFMLLQIQNGLLTPSNIVDCVWRQHLQYTQNYRGIFLSDHGLGSINRDPSQFSYDLSLYSYQHTYKLYYEHYQITPPTEFWPLDWQNELFLRTKKVSEPRFAELWEKIWQYKLPIELFAIMSQVLKLTNEEMLLAFEEYKKFLFLGVVAGPVTPSLIVDEIWHAHLGLTNDYWSHLCKNILGTSFEHSPGDGAPGSEDQYQKQYYRTLDKYYYFFQQDPPNNIWGHYKVLT